MAKSKPATVYVFKVALKDAKQIWRRIAIRGDQTLDDLHEGIYEAFDREEEHLYSFYFPPRRSTSRKALRDATEYTHPEAVDDGGWGDAPVQSAAATKLRDLNLTPRQRFLYVFDFGDEWWHELTVESIDTPRNKKTYPCTIEVHGKSPPQYPDDDFE